MDEPTAGKTPVCHDCLVVNGTSQLIINIPSGTAARVLTYGHPPETITKVLTYGHSPGHLKHVPLRYHVGIVRGRIGRFTRT